MGVAQRGESLVLIAAEDTPKGIGRIRISTISDASGDVLTNTVQQMVSVGSTIRTDGWAGYSGLSNLGYVHLPMSNHNVKEDGVVE